MEDLNTHVLKVEGKKNRNGGDRYIVSLGNGNDYTTFELELAQKAASLMAPPGAQPIPVSARVEYDGKYKNLEDIAPLGQLPPMAVPGGMPIGGFVQPQQFAQPQPAQATPPPTIPFTSGGGGMDPERERKIVTQSSFATAFGFVGSLFNGAGPEALEEATQASLELAERLYRNVYAPAVAEQPMPETPQEVAAQVNAELPAAVQVGAENVPQWS